MCIYHKRPVLLLILFLLACLSRRKSIVRLPLGHMSDRFSRSKRPGYPHPVSSELENSGIRVAVDDCSVTERRRWCHPYQTCKTVHVHAKHYKHNEDGRTAPGVCGDARHFVEPHFVYCDTSSKVVELPVRRKVTSSNSFSSNTTLSRIFHSSKYLVDAMFCSVLFCIYILPDLRMSKPTLTLFRAIHCWASP